MHLLFSDQIIQWLDEHLLNIKSYNGEQNISNWYEKIIFRVDYQMLLKSNQSWLEKKNQ